MSRLPGLTFKHLLPGLVLLIAMSIPVVRSFASDDPADGPAITIDAPGEVIVVGEDEQLVISGWAGDYFGDGTGIETIHVYADGEPGSGGILLGSANYGMPRADVAVATGRPAWENSGFNFAWTPTGLAPGPHTLYFYAYSPARNQWNYSTLGVNVAPRGVTNRYLVNPYVDGLNYNYDYNYNYNTAQNCSSGYVTATGQCIYSPSSGSCQPGYGYQNGACVPWSGSGACPAGFHQNSTQCIPDSSNVSCPSGYVVSLGNCFPDNNSNAGLCPSGYVAVNGVCTGTNFNTSCPAGYVFDGVSCVVYPYPGSTSCTAGYAYINGVCRLQSSGTSNTTVNVPAVFCQSGSVYVNGSCQTSGVGGLGGTTCSAGYQYVNGQCIYYGGNTGQCGAGYIYQNGQCYYGGGQQSCAGAFNPYGFRC